MVDLFVSKMAKHSSMTRITLLLPDLAAGGAERVMLTLAREFDVKGYQIDLLVFRAEGHLRECVPDGVRLVDLGVRTLGLGEIGLALYAVRHLRKWIRDEKPGVLISTVTGANLLALLVKEARRSSISVVVRQATVSGYLGLHPAAVKFPKQPIERRP